MADPNDVSLDDNTDEREELENDSSNECDETQVEFSLPKQPMALCFGFDLLCVCVLDSEMGAILLSSLFCLFLVTLNVHGIWHVREKGISLGILVLVEIISQSLLLFLIQYVLTPKGTPLDFSFLLIPLLLGLVYLILVAMPAPVNYFKAKMLALHREDEDSPSPRLVGMLNKVFTVSIHIMHLVALLQVLGCTFEAVMFVHESMIYHHNNQNFGWLIAVGFLGLCSVFYLFATIRRFFTFRRSDSFAENELEIPLLPGDIDPAPGFDKEFFTD